MSSCGLNKHATPTPELNTPW